MPTILLPPQLFNVNDFVFSPRPQDRFRKIFFQSVFRTFGQKNGEIVIEMGLIAYPAWKRGNSPFDTWNIGGRVVGVNLAPADPNNPEETVVFNPADPLALGNNETPVWHWHPLGENIKQEKPQSAIQETLNKFFSGDEKFIKEEFNMKSRLYKKNLHVEYDATFSDGTVVSANPCPPNQPGEPS